MPHISRRFVDKNKFSEINKQFYKTIKTLVYSDKTKVILDELLTKTEKIMLAKRLAVILMVDKQESAYAIENILKVSPSTVTRMQLSYENGDFTGLLKEVKNQSSLLVQLQKIIPPRVGRNRFKHFLKF